MINEDPFSAIAAVARHHRPLIDAAQSHLSEQRGVADRLQAEASKIAAQIDRLVEAERNEAARRLLAHVDVELTRAKAGQGDSND